MPSKKLFCAMVPLAIGPGGTGCASRDQAASEQAGSASATEMAPLVCTPLYTAQAPLLTCGASAATHMALARRVEAKTTAQMHAAFARLTLAPNFAPNQVVITSRAVEFASLFGAPILAPLAPGGAFTIAAPLTLGTQAPNVTLVANVFGAVPALSGPFATAAPLWSAGPLAPATEANASFAAFNAAALASAALNSSALDRAAINVATMPLTILISTPTTAAAPVVCSGAISMECL